MSVCMNCDRLALELANALDLYRQAERWRQEALMEVSRLRMHTVTIDEAIERLGKCSRDEILVGWLEYCRVQRSDAEAEE
jgi:hypothetical protein